MSEKYQKIAGSKIKFSFKVEDADIEKATKQTIESFKQNAELKGFRKGHAPEEAIVNHFGAERISFEAINRSIDKNYRRFIIDNKIQPIAEPKIDFSDLKKTPIEIKVEVEVFPEIEVGDYKKIKMNKPEIKIEGKEVDETIERIMTQMGMGKPVKRAAKKGDLIEIDFAGKDKDGKVLPNTDGKNHKITIGGGQFLPDLEKAFEGMKGGEEKEAVGVKFPKNYHSPDFAGKTIPFDIKLHSVLEISSKKLEEDDIEKITGKKMSDVDFRADVEKMLLAEKERNEKGKAMHEYETALAKITKADLPVTWLEREAEMRMEQLKSNPQFMHDPETFWKSVGKKEEDMKKQFQKDAEDNLKVFLALSHIVEKEEKIELDKDEQARAEGIATKNSQDKKQDFQTELQRATLNLKIDKFTNGLML